MLHFFGKIKDSIAHMGPNELTLFSRFSSNRATRPIQSSSRDVRLSSCLMSPSHAIFLRGGTGACVARQRTGVCVRRRRGHPIACVEP